MHIQSRLDRIAVRYPETEHLFDTVWEGPIPRCHARRRLTAAPAAGDRWTIRGRPRHACRGPSSPMRHRAEPGT